MESQLHQPQPGQQEPERRASFLKSNNVCVQARYEFTHLQTHACSASLAWPE